MEEEEYKHQIELWEHLDNGDSGAFIGRILDLECEEGSLHIKVKINDLCLAQIKISITEDGDIQTTTFLSTDGKDWFDSNEYSEETKTLLTTTQIKKWFKGVSNEN